MPCHGNGPDHCCYVNGQLCPFLEENSEQGRRWTCGLRRELGSWPAVHTHPLYAPVRAAFEATGTRLCGDFGPIEAQCCWGYWANPAAPTVTLVNAPGMGAPLRPARRGKTVKV